MGAAVRPLRAATWTAARLAADDANCAVDSPCPCLALFHPRLDIWTIAYFAGIVAFFSASQDIVLDAYRRELLPDIELGLGNAVHVNAYKIAGLIPGSLSLILADHLPWSSVFLITALFMLPGSP